MALEGSYGYLAPEALNRKGHGKPVDLWAIGYLLFLSWGDDLFTRVKQSDHLHASLRILTLPVR